MKLTHKQKIKIARKSLSNTEKARKVTPFNSKAWNARHEAIEKRIAKKVTTNQKRRIIRDKHIKQALSTSSIKVDSAIV